jgi:hypothetical protein
MTDLPSQLLPLAQQLYRRLELRIGPLRENISGIRNSCAARGLGNSGAFIRQILTAFQTEAELRLETIERTLRSYRLSCSPSLIVMSEDRLCKFLDILVAQHCQYIRYECEQAISPVLKALGDSADQQKTICEQRFFEVTRNTRGLIEGIAKEIVVAARSDMEATTKEERPSYVYNNTIQGPLGALAQGGSTIGRVSQSNNLVASIDEIHRLLKAATADWAPNEKRQVDGAAAMLVAGAQADEPDTDLLRAAVSKIGNVAMGVAQSVATQALISYLTLNGWLS